jgi:hypothetical protein
MRWSMLVLVPCLPSISGCLFVYTTEETVRNGESRRPVAFQSETGERLFAATVEKQRERPADLGSRSLAIPFLAYISKTTRLSDAAIYNDEVVACDTDANGVITDAEAVAYHRLNCKSSGSPESEGDSHDLLVQTGSMRVAPSQGPVEVYYPRPFAYQPELTFPDQSVPYGKLEQSAQGFRIYFKDGTWSGTVRWQARGITTDRTSSPLAGSPQEPPARFGPVTAVSVETPVSDAP